jgi:hypothetical protein
MFLLTLFAMTVLMRMLVLMLVGMAPRCSMRMRVSMLVRMFVSAFHRTPPRMAIVRIRGLYHSRLGCLQRDSYPTAALGRHGSPSPTQNRYCSSKDAFVLKHPPPYSSRRPNDRT